MKSRVIPIGNSKGIRIPRAVLDLCHVKDAVDLQVKGNLIIIRPIQERPRTGWDAVFEAMHQRQEDRLLFDDRMDLALGAWEW